jgi:hypothetical protein
MPCVRISWPAGVAEQKLVMHHLSQLAKYRPTDR